LHKHTAKTYRKTAALVGVSLGTVCRAAIILEQQTGSVCPKGKGMCGWKKKTNSRDGAYSENVNKVSAKQVTNQIRILRRNVSKSVPLQFADVSSQLVKRSEALWKKVF